MKRKEFLASLGCFALAPVKMLRKKTKLYGSGFRHHEGVTFGFHMDDCDYDCLVTIQKRKMVNDRRHDSVCKELSKRWKRCLDETRGMPDEDRFASFDHDKMLQKWVMRLAERY